MICYNKQKQNKESGMIEVQKVEVWLNGIRVGTLAQTPYKPITCAFEYTREWLQNGFSISPLELPLTAGVKIAAYHPFDGLFGVFADSLPDGWGNLILQRYLQLHGINYNNLSVLQQLCLVGSLGRGALEYHPDESIRKTQEYLSFEQFAAEADAVLKDDNYNGEHLEEMVQRGGSPGGARPKLFVKYGNDEWLVKFRAKGDKKDIGKVEYKYSLLAKKCGIEMPETRLFDNCWFATKRFDRYEDKKRHVVSAAGLLRADYRIPCIDYEHLFRLSARLSHSVEELWKVYRLMCFNVIIGNLDDHAKNFSFLYDNGWHFAPAYDLLPSGIEGDYHTTSVNDNPLPQKNDILAVAQKVGLNIKTATNIYDEMLQVYKNEIEMA